MPVLKNLLSSALHLFYPHLCTGCGSDLLPAHEMLCLQCISELPHTCFEQFALNKTERLFIGRMPVTAAHSEFYFTKGTVIQQLIHELKYNGDREIGVYLGKICGDHLFSCNRFTGIDYIIPLPLFAEREFKRGYNQAEVIAEGISANMNVPLLPRNLQRVKFTSTQTKKHRAARWENVADSFIVRDPGALERKHLLLVDDVITTGATLEACGQKLLEIPGVRISIATLAIA